MSYEYRSCSVCDNTLSEDEKRRNNDLCDLHDQMARNTPAPEDSVRTMVLKLINYCQIKEDIIASEYGDDPESIRERFALLYGKIGVSL